MRTQLIIGSSVVIGAAHKQKKKSTISHWFLSGNRSRTLTEKTRTQLVIGSSVVIGAAHKQKKREHN